jgi:hypothetical protein
MRNSAFMECRWPSRSWPDFALASHGGMSRPCKSEYGYSCASAHPRCQSTVFPSLGLPSLPAWNPALYSAESSFAGGISSGSGSSLISSISPMSHLVVLVAYSAVIDQRHLRTTYLFDAVGSSYGGSSRTARLSIAGYSSRRGWVCSAWRPVVVLLFVFLLISPNGEEPFSLGGFPRKSDAFRIEDRAWRCHRNGSASNRNPPEIQIWLIGDHEGFKAGSDNKESDEHKSFDCSRDGLRLRNKTDIQLGIGDTQPMPHGTFVGGYLFQLRSKRYNSHRFH